MVGLVGFDKIVGMWLGGRGDAPDGLVKSACLRGRESSPPFRLLAVRREVSNLSCCG